MECLHRLLLNESFSLLRFDPFVGSFLCIQHHKCLMNNWKNRWFFSGTWRKLHTIDCVQCTMFHETNLPSPIFSIFTKSSIFLCNFSLLIQWQWNAFYLEKKLNLNILQHLCITSLLLSWNWCTVIMRKFTCLQIDHFFMRYCYYKSKYCGYITKIQINLDETRQMNFFMHSEWQMKRCRWHSASVSLPRKIQSERQQMQWQLQSMLVRR